MDAWWLGFFTGAIPTTIAALLGWVKWWYEVRESNRLRKSKEKAEAEITLYRRRSFEVSPYLTLSSRRFEGAQIPSHELGMDLWLSAGHPNMLCFLREEVGTLTKKQIVFLVVENEGKKALDAKVTIEDDLIQVIEPQNFEINDLILLGYPYDPELHGKIQTLALEFDRTDGVRDRQLYQTKHGIRYLRRIDPV